MEIKDDITRRKIELTIEILQAALQGKDIEYNSTNNGWNKTENLLAICPAIIEYCRIANNYRPCTEDEFIQLLLKDTENMRLIHKTTGKVYYIHAIRNNTVQLVNNNDNVIATYYELFKDYEFCNRIDTIIGVENK